MAVQQSSNISDRLASLTKEELDAYRLAIDVETSHRENLWTVVRFFTGMQVAILGAIATISRLAANSGRDSDLTMAILFTAGAVLGLAGVYMLRTTRSYHLNALIAKSRLEQSLGLVTDGSDTGWSRLAWTYPDSEVHEMLSDPAGWKQRTMIRWRSNTLGLFLAYGILFVLNIAGVVLALAGKL